MQLIVRKSFAGAQVQKEFDVEDAVLKDLAKNAGPRSETDSEGKPLIGRHFTTLGTLATEKDVPIERVDWHGAHGKSSATGFAILAPDAYASEGAFLAAHIVEGWESKS